MFDELDLLELEYDMTKVSEDNIIVRDSSLYEYKPKYSGYYHYKYIDSNRFYSEKTKMKKVKLFSMVEYGNMTEVAPSYIEDSVSAEKVFFIEVIFYLYLTGELFDKFLGVKEAYMQIEQFQPTKVAIKVIRSVYATVGIMAHKSGEIAVPSNLAQYNWMKYVDFSNDYASYTIKPKSLCNINNPLKEALYTQAEEKYFATQYKGSKKEKHDKYIKNRENMMIEKSQQLKAEADLALFECMINGRLAQDSSIDIVTLQHDIWDTKTKKPVYITELVLTIGSYESLVKMAGTQFFQYFVNGRGENGTTLRIKKSYTLVNTPQWSLDEDEQKKMIPTLEKCLHTLSDININDEDIKVMLWIDLMDEFKGYHVLEMEIEHFFWNNGLEDFFLKIYGAPEVTEDEYYDYIANCELNVKIGA